MTKFPIFLDDLSKFPPVFVPMLQFLLVIYLSFRKIIFRSQTLPNPSTGFRDNNIPYLTPHRKSQPHHIGAIYLFLQVIFVIIPIVESLK